MGIHSKIQYIQYVLSLTRSRRYDLWCGYAARQFFNISNLSKNKVNDAKKIRFDFLNTWDHYTFPYIFIQSFGVHFFEVQIYGIILYFPCTVDIRYIYICIHIYNVYICVV